MAAYCIGVKDKMRVIQIKTKTEIEKLIYSFFDEFPAFSLDKEKVSELADKLSRYGVVKGLVNNNETCAYAGFYCNDSENKIAYISMIANSSKYRGQGYGKAILDEVCKTSIEAGMNKLRLEVRNDNVIALGFYTRNGFVFEKPASSETQYMIKDLK